MLTSLYHISAITLIKPFFDIAYLLNSSDPDSSVIEHITKEAIVKEVLIDRPSIGIADKGTITCPKCLLRFLYCGEGSNNPYLNCGCNVFCVW